VTKNEEEDMDCYFCTDPAEHYWVPTLWGVLPVCDVHYRAAGRLTTSRKQRTARRARKDRRPRFLPGQRVFSFLDETGDQPTVACFSDSTSSRSK
jgi:hypothetical protein